MNETCECLQPWTYRVHRCENYVIGVDSNVPLVVRLLNNYCRTQNEKRMLIFFIKLTWSSDLLVFFIIYNNIGPANYQEIIYYCERAITHILVLRKKIMARCIKTGSVMYIFIFRIFLIYVYIYVYILLFILYRCFTS